MKQLLLLGGGHSHVEVLRRFGLRAPANTRVTLVSPDRYTAYSGMLPGFIAGHYGFHDCHIDLERLSGFAKAEFRKTSAVGVDPLSREVTLSDGSALPYDILSIDVGSEPPSTGVPGISDQVIAVRPVADFLRKWEELVRNISEQPPSSLAIVGGGAAGVELLLSMQHRIARMAPSATTRFLLVTDLDRPLASHAPTARSIFGRVLRERNVGLHLNSRVTQLEPGVIITAGGQRIAADRIVWATGPGAPHWLRKTGLAVDAAGYISINANLQSTDHGEVFAAGDCATIQGERYPKSGVYAVRQGPLLADNLLLALTGKPLRIYQPQRRALALISTGDQYAVASYGDFALGAKWIWRWKDRIDRKFMLKYNTPPPEPA